MVYCKFLKFVKLFYLSISTFHASSTLVQGPDGRPVAFQNMIRSIDSSINHKYTFLSNASYSHCFGEPRDITWLYKDGQRGYKVVSFARTQSPKSTPSITPKPVRLSPTKPLTPSPSRMIKPVTRGSSIRRFPTQPKRNSNDTDSSSDEE